MTAPFAVNVDDMAMTQKEVVDAVADAVFRYEGFEATESRAALANFLERLAEALRPPLKGPPWRESLEQVGLEDNIMPALTAALVRTGQLRDRDGRLDLAECCYSLAGLLGDKDTPDELWERWLDRRDLTPSDRMRGLAKVSPGYGRARSDLGYTADDSSDAEAAP